MKGLRILFARSLQRCMEFDQKASASIECVDASGRWILSFIESEKFFSAPKAACVFVCSPLE
jgi:hypothetical protein